MSRDRAVRATVTATVTDPAAAAVPIAGHPWVDVSDVELRADLTGEVDPAVARRPGGRLIYSLRSATAGGRASEDTIGRTARLLAAAGRFDVVDLEAERDLRPELLDRIPPEQRRICWYGPAGDAAELRRQFDRMAQVPAGLYLLAPAAASVEQAVAPLRLLRELGRPDVTAFGTGPAGTWSRLLAPFLGAPVVYGRWNPTDSSGPPETTGAPTVEQLLLDYPFPTMPRLERLYGIVGRRTSGSLSPRMHNAAYRTIRLPALFLPWQSLDLAAVWPHLVDSGLPGLGLRLDGLTVTSPLKETAVTLVPTVSRAAHAAGGANLLVRRRSGWHAYTTDGYAVVAALRHRRIRLAGTSVAVLGCGGAGRSAAAELTRAGAVVTLVNRGARRGRTASALLGLPLVPLAALDPGRYRIVVNATPLIDEHPVAADRLDGDAVVVDFVYGPKESALMSTARGRGLVAIDGWEILSREVRRQFAVMTGRAMPATAVAGSLPVVGVPA